MVTMEKRLYTTRRPEYPEDSESRLREEAGTAWRKERPYSEDVFPDNAPPELKLEYLKEYAATVRECMSENSEMLRDLERQIRKFATKR